jgi:hypothetical protein
MDLKVSVQEIAPKNIKAINKLTNQCIQTLWIIIPIKQSQLWRKDSRWQKTGFTMGINPFMDTGIRILPQVVLQDIW